MGPKMLYMLLCGFKSKVVGFTIMFQIFKRRPYHMAGHYGFTYEDQLVIEAMVHFIKRCYMLISKENCAYYGPETFRSNICILEFKGECSSKR